jgi:hypothetical protein
MKNIYKPLLLLLFIVAAFDVFSQAVSEHHSLQWKAPVPWDATATESSELVISFDDASFFDNYGLLPVFTRRIPMDENTERLIFEIKNIQWKPVTDDMTVIEDNQLITDEPQHSEQIATTRGERHTIFRLMPLRFNITSGNFEKIISFELSWQIAPFEENAQIQRDSIPNYADNSVLAAGQWFKIGVTTDGIYKLTYEQLQQLGLQGSVASSAVALYGNGGGMLPQANEDFRYDDLQENAIEMHDGDDGSFDAGDYFVFYGQSPHAWKYSNIKQAYEYALNKFSDTAYYFINTAAIDGKRLQVQPSAIGSPQDIINSYNDFASHEIDSINIIRSGREWYGETFNEQLSYDFHFPFPKRDVSENMHVSTDVAARSAVNSKFVIRVNGDSIYYDNVSSVLLNSPTKYANVSDKSRWFKANDEQDVNVNISYLKPDNFSMGWLNFVTVNVMSHLIYDGNFFSFRNRQQALPNSVSQFIIGNVETNFNVWNITNPLVPRQMAATFDDGVCKITIQSDVIEEFIGFTSLDYQSPVMIGSIDNQNLHQLGAADFIIVTHPLFLEQAERLKALHEDVDNMIVHVVTTDQVYNEFGSGIADPTAIRDFVRMIYYRSPAAPKLKYLLLVGDGSYDPKNRIGENQNMVPTFEAKNSHWYAGSFVTDDYFGLMDAGEGKESMGSIDLGIGRFPVVTQRQATDMVDKVESYMRLTNRNQGAWRNQLCFMADDGNGNLHVLQADTILVRDIMRKNRDMNINKIYIDAYPLESTANGNTFPQANKSFNDQMQEGALIVNYTGHGGETGLTHESVVEISDILSWKNYDRLPLVITATCEFSRFDNPALTSAGELVLLNPHGGGIALLTTVRIAFASVNLVLNRRIYDTLFTIQGTNSLRFGDLIMKSKLPSSSSFLNFVLLGDPALRLALPQHDIITDSINGQPANYFRDTLSANSTITISGHIQQHNMPGALLSDFNGTVYPVFYDKPEQVTTLGSASDSYPYTFELQNKILCQGKASVKNGRFSYTFVLPRDIDYNFGYGKLSYYATDSARDASGYFSGLVVGGPSQNSQSDNSGPDISLFLNDSTFIPGTAINPTPLFLARLSDPSGINATGAGIGHDIVLTIDENTSHAIILNDRFDPELDDHSSGSIALTLGPLSNGMHTLRLRAWDMYNNSSEKTLEFFVADSVGVSLLNVYNYPNPFRNETWFTFRHNQFEGALSATIEIYDFYGKLVETLDSPVVYTSGYAIEPIYWDGTSRGGEKLAPGMYIYRVRVNNDKGDFTERVQKLIITD